MLGTAYELAALGQLELALDATPSAARDLARVVLTLGARSRGISEHEAALSTDAERARTESLAVAGGNKNHRNVHDLAGQYHV